MTAAVPPKVAADAGDVPYVEAAAFMNAVGGRATDKQTDPAKGIDKELPRRYA